MSRSAKSSDRSAASRAPWRVSAAAIRRFARGVAERFDPDRIILFGSYAYGRPHRYSDVDILVVVPARNEIDKSVHILDALDPPFDADLIVRSPRNLEWRLREGDWFLREVVSRGKVLYEKTDGGVGPKGRSRSRHRPPRVRRQAAGA
ncbi:MAG TPA: nucleotidyltransferase domain-containing protein [Gemmataceae bacterium]|jgi:predicted nucleotidyltransferase